MHGFIDDGLDDSIDITCELPGYRLDHGDTAGHQFDKEYDLTSRASAFKYLRGRFSAGEITTGPLYLDESRVEMHELLGNVDTPLSQLPLDGLIPGGEDLKKLQNRCR